MATNPAAAGAPRPVHTVTPTAPTSGKKDGATARQALPSPGINLEPDPIHAANPLQASKSTSTHRPKMHKRSATGIIVGPNESLKSIFPEGSDPKAWTRAIKSTELKNDTDSIEASIVQHVHSSLARAAYNLDTVGVYQAVALAARDRLIQDWNDTQIYQTQKTPKRVYYLSLEFLLGRSLDNALLNLKVKKEFEHSINDLGFNMEDLLDSERDAGLGNGGLGRLAACYMDSLATMDIPAWGYGLRYQYGIFMQGIDQLGQQTEIPDPWLTEANPWEVPRLDNTVTVRLYGRADRNASGLKRWTGGAEVLAVPYDVPIPGYNTINTNNIRLWKAQPKRGFDLQTFNAGDYDGSVKEGEAVETITRVLYPNDNHWAGKELRLKQQYFWTAASLSDIIRRWKKIGVPWSEFPHYVAIQLNDTHPTLAIVELQRILVDEENIQFDDAWQIVTSTFAYTNHTVLPEALECWPVPLITNLLPRHMQIIFDVNLNFLKQVEKKWPGDRDRLARMSLIQEGSPQQVRMAWLAIVGSHAVNGVAELHSQLVRVMLKDFVEFYGPDKFKNVTNGVTFRRWLLQCNPGLAELINETLGSDKWLTNAALLRNLENKIDDPAFVKRFYDIKHQNKVRLAEYIERTLNIPINPTSLFSIQVKRIHEYKRQLMNVFGCIHRYLTLKKMSPTDRKKVVPRVEIFAGKAAPGYYIAKLVIRLINAVSKIVNADKDLNDILQVVFLPDYSVSLAELIIPASDISQHISTAGTEASGTSNMKFALNGGLLLGTVDGATIEIAEEVGDDQVFFFGHTADHIEELRHNHRYGELVLPPALQGAMDAIRQGVFGDPNPFQPLLASVIDGKDYYCLSDDFESYLQAHHMIDEAFIDKRSWTKKCILTTARMGKFSSDRCVLEYADEIWSAEPVRVPYHLEV